MGIMNQSREETENGRGNTTAEGIYRAGVTFMKYCDYCDDQGMV